MLNSACSIWKAHHVCSREKTQSDLQNASTPSPPYRERIERRNSLNRDSQAPAVEQVKSTKRNNTHPKWTKINGCWSNYVILSLLFLIYYYSGSALSVLPEGQNIPKNYIKQNNFTFLTLNNIAIEVKLIIWICYVMPVNTVHGITKWLIFDYPVFHV